MMQMFDEPVSRWMVQPVRTIHEEHALSEARDLMSRLGVSALPVINGTGRLCGVIGRTDLLRVGRTPPVAERRERAVGLPEDRVRDHMRSSLELVAPTAPLRTAARRMIQRKIHRIYVARERVAVGVVSTLEMVQAVALSGAEAPIESLGSEKVVLIPCDAPLSLAVDRLVASHHSVLVVVDGVFPIGLFGPEEALAARNAPAASPVERWVDAGFLSVAPGMPAYRAARQVVATRPRCALVTRGTELLRIVTGTDFTRMVAGA